MAYKTLVCSKLELIPPYSKSQVNQLEKVQRTAARWSCHVGDMLNELEWPTLEDRREQVSLAFFHKKTHSGIVAIERKAYLTLTSSRLRQTRASRELQYTRYLTYSDALKYSFFTRSFPVWNALPASVVSVESTEEFKSLI